MSDKNRKSVKMAVKDAELVIQAQQGNMNAFEKLVQMYDKQILTIAAGYVNSSDDAKDIYQEVFIRVYKGLPAFKHRSEFSTWLFRIATNVCLSYKSRRKKEGHISLDRGFDIGKGGPVSVKDTLKADSQTDRRTHDEELSMRIEQALANLSPRQRMVFTLKHYEGYKLKEIAAMIGCSEGAVKKYLFEAVGRLRDRLSDFEE
jgi:RNA polymerase sigma-70 factor (ECF subfamily)